MDNKCALFRVREGEGHDGKRFVPILLIKFRKILKFKKQTPTAPTKETSQTNTLVDNGECDVS